MRARFRLIFEGGEPDIDLPSFRASLPNGFEVMEEADGLYLSTNSRDAEDERCQYIVDRELDRHFFLTSVKITAELVRKQVVKSFTVRYRIHGELPEGIGPQRWSYELPIQLRLWAIAVDTQDISLKALLLFQIIELSHPTFPAYKDASTAPHPLTECKFLRHLVAHSGGVSSTQLRKYCDYLDIPELMFDPTDSTHNAILAKKVGLLEAQAKDHIQLALT